MAGWNIVSFRVHAGDEASCLNLNRAQKPRLLGMNPESLAGRFTFAGVARGLEISKPGNCLSPPRFHLLIRRDSPLSAMPIRSNGRWQEAGRYDRLHGRTRPIFQDRLVGAVANSILQGSLLSDESEFVRRFPGESGFGFSLWILRLLRANISATSLAH